MTLKNQGNYLKGIKSVNLTLEIELKLTHRKILNQALIILEAKR